MSGFGNWAKKNWLILVLAAVALAALPAGWYFSNSMNARLRDRVQADADKDYRLVSNYRLDYTIPSLKSPGTPAFRVSDAANQVFIDAFKAQRDAIKSEAGKIAREAVDFNHGVGRVGPDGKPLGERKPLIEGIFPVPGVGDEQLKPWAMREAYTKTAHPALLARVRAGKPLDPALLAAQLKDYEQQQTLRLRAASGSTQVSPDEQAKLNKELLDKRLGHYRQHATEISFYADPAVFADVPATITGDTPRTRFWEWQMRYWVHEDLMHAVALANSRGDTSLGVPNSVVKRILKVTVRPPMNYHDASDSTPAEQLVNAETVTKDPVEPDYSVSFTGRTSGPTTGNQFYDAWTATLEIIVSSRRLPEFFNALARTNYMTVLKCDLESVEPFDHLREGYYYGDEHVVKATLTIETLWLRAWTLKHMPPTVKFVLGVVEEPVAADPGEGG